MHFMGTGRQAFLQPPENERARGKYLATWNSDDIYNEAHVEVLVRASNKTKHLVRHSIIRSFSRIRRQVSIRENGRASSLDLIVPEARLKSWPHRFSQSRHCERKLHDRSLFTDRENQHLTS